MITYVNNVFVSNSTNGALATTPEAVEKGQFIVYDIDENAYTLTATTTRFKIGMGTGKTAKDHKGGSHNVIKWSNIINAADIKSISNLDYPGEDTEDTIEIDFTEIDQNVMNLLDNGGKRVIVRLTFKDLPTRFRNWTESYEYVTVEGDTKESIVSGIADIINKQWKRARVEAVADGTKLTLTAMKYDDDESVDSLSWYNKVRFNANIYFTDPAADGWESLNKNYPKGVKIDKKPGTTYAASAKLVRDREAQAMGYDGILNRGEGTWPIIKPAMETQLNGKYNAITVEFENMYRAADDIFRKTKESVEVYTTASTTALLNAIKTVTSKNDRFTSDTKTESGNIVSE